MLPMNDFNFVVAGLATFAATVGYACTRRLSASIVGSDSDAIRDVIRGRSKVDQPKATDVSVLVVEKSVDAGLDTIPDSEHLTAMPTNGSKENLKRKIPHDGFEEPEKPVNSELGYPHNLAHIYPPPNKRFKTPPGADAKAPAPVVELTSTQITNETEESPLNIGDLEPAVETPISDPPLSPSPVADTPSPAPTPPSYVPTTPQPTPLQSAWTPPTTAFPKSFGNSSFSGGFAAFAGSTSPFSTVAGNTPPSELCSIWSAARSDLTSHQNDEVGTTTKLSDVFRPNSQLMPVNVLEETKKSTSPSPKHTHFTGEEDEDIEMELKGVKLYVKRGAKSYGEGIFGHLKLLCHRTSLEERILFRREPLWKVSMNVRVQPTVRCAFVPEENALKFILKENVESASVDSPEVMQELVIYVVKPGRSCSKQDFRDFATTLSENARFRTPTETLSFSH